MKVNFIKNIYLVSVIKTAMKRQSIG